MPRYGLIGYPLGHSFSKKYFTEKFLQSGLSDFSYDLFPISSIEELPELIASNPDLAGLNVTIPYKQQVISYLSEADDAVQHIGACNCIHIIDGKLKGYNTDTIGFRQSLKPLLKNNQEYKALVLGNGGAAAAVKYVLESMNIDFLVVSRKNKKEDEIVYEALTHELIEDHKLLINTTPLGMYPHIDECPDLPYESISSEHILYDLVYNPVKTKFLEVGEKKGATIQNGMDMLIIQAEESWRIWQEEN